MSKLRLAIRHLLPFFIATALIEVIWKHSIILFALCLSIMMVQILLGNDKKFEFKIAIYGIIWGAILEITSTKISGFHSFTNADFMCIPFWLPVTWGYGFVMAKRISSIIYTGKPFMNG